MSRLFRRWGVAAAAVAAVAVAAPAAAQTKITVGLAVWADFVLPLVTADKKGFFKESGLAVETINFKGGGPAAQALLGGSTEFCLCSYDHVIRIRNRGQDVIALAGIEIFHSYLLIAKAGTPYDSIASLKGKKIGITASGSMTDVTVRHDISALKLDPQRDFQLINVGNPAPMKAAIEQGQVEAGMVNSALVEEMLAQPEKFKVVVNYRDMPYSASTVLARGKWLSENEDTAKKFVGALVKALKLLHADPVVAAEMLKTMFPELSDDTIKLAAVSSVKRFSKDGTIDAAAAQNVTDRIIQADPSLKPLTYDQAVTRRYLPM